MIRQLTTLTFVATLSMLGMPLLASASSDESGGEASKGRVLTLNGYDLWEVLHSPDHGSALATLAARRSRGRQLPPTTRPRRDVRSPLVGGIDGRLGQQAQKERIVNRRVSLAGPRFGLTYLSDGTLKKLRDEYEIDISPVVSQFGWQFERQFTVRENGPTALNEWVLLVGGLDQGVVIPSLTWLVGIRTDDGTEFGLGPNLTPAGVSLALAYGITFRTGDLNVPVNVAVVPSRSGVRVSFLTGWNIRR